MARNNKYILCRTRYARPYNTSHKLQTLSHIFTDFQKYYLCTILGEDPNKHVPQQDKTNNWFTSVIRVIQGTTVMLTNKAHFVKRHPCVGTPPRN